MDHWEHRTIMYGHRYDHHHQPSRDLPSFAPAAPFNFVSQRFYPPPQPDCSSVQPLVAESMSHLSSSSSLGAHTQGHGVATLPPTTGVRPSSARSFSWAAPGAPWPEPAAWGAAARQMHTIGGFIPSSIPAFDVHTHRRAHSLSLPQPAAYDQLSPFVSPHLHANASADASAAADASAPTPPPDFAFPVLALTSFPAQLTSSPSTFPWAHYLMRSTAYGSSTASMQTAISSNPPQLGHSFISTAHLDSGMLSRNNSSARINTPLQGRERYQHSHAPPLSIETGVTSRSTTATGFHDEETVSPTSATVSYSTDSHSSSSPNEEVGPVQAIAGIFSHSGQTSASSAFLSSPKRVDRRAKYADEDEDGAFEEKDRLALVRLAYEQADAGSAHLLDFSEFPRSSLSPTSITPALPSRAEDFAGSSSPIEPSRLSPALFASPPQKPIFSRIWSSVALEEVVSSNSDDEGDRQRLGWVAPKAPVPASRQPTSTSQPRSASPHGMTEQQEIYEESDHHQTTLLVTDQNLPSSPLSSLPPSDPIDPPSPLLKPLPRLQSTSKPKPKPELEPRPSPSIARTELAFGREQPSMLFGPFMASKEVTTSTTESQDLDPKLNPPELTHSKDAANWIAYRRNYLSFDVFITLPSSRPPLFVLGQRVRHFTTTVKALNVKPDRHALSSKSKHKHPVPTYVSLLQFDLSRKLARATELQPHAFEPSSEDPHARALVSSYSRVQFRHATANHSMGSINANGIGKTLRLVVKLMAQLETGDETEVGFWESAEIVVRGRCPKNFDEVGTSQVGGDNNKKKTKLKRSKPLHGRRADRIDLSSDEDAWADEEVDVAPRGTRSRPGRQSGVCALQDQDVPDDTSTSGRPSKRIKL